MMKQINRWSCSVAALSYLLGEDVTSRLSHDGSEILWPHRPEPACRRGFHPQELATVALSYGYALVEFASEMQIGHTIEEVVTFPIKMPLAEYPGLIYGRARINMHWWALRDNMVFDPTSGDLITLDSFNYTISSFYALLRLAP